MKSQVQVEDVNTVKKILHIEVPEESVTEALDNAYRELKKNARVKGFRPGKAPRSVLERVYRKDVHADVASQLIQTSFAESVQERKLNIVGPPKVEPTELKAGSPYLYDAVVELQPELDDVDFKGLKLKRTLYVPTEEEIDAQLKNLQKNMASKEKIEEQRPVETGDYVVIDYEGLKDGKPFAETGKTENYTMKVGDGQIAAAFDEQLVGMQPGEDRKVPVIFDDDHANEKLRGQTIVFQVKLHDIREEKLPDLDDDFAKSVGKFESLDNLKQVVRDNLTQGYEKRKEQELNEQIFQALIQKTTFEVPEAMVEFELENILQDAERSFQYYNRSLEELGLTRDQMAQQYREVAEKQVRRHIILSKIVAQEKLELPDEALFESYTDMSAQFGRPVEEVKAYYEQNSDKRDHLKHTLLAKKAIDVILEHSDIEDLPPEKEPPEEDAGASEGVREAENDGETAAEKTAT